MFQCTMSVFVNGGTFAFPAGVLGTEVSQPPTINGTSGDGPCVVLTSSELQLHLRLHDFFLGERMMSYVKYTKSRRIRRNDF